MGPVAVIGISALIGGVFLGFVAETNTLLGVFMGAILGGGSALAALAFPVDLDYRERRIWPPRAR